MRQNQNISTLQAVVTKKTSGSYEVKSDQGTLPCTSKSNGKPEEIIVVGDRVTIGQTTAGWVILQREPRTNWLSRRSAVPMPTARAHEQIFVANVDQLVTVFAAANPAPKWNMLDRYLVAAEAQDVPVLICLTKIDLASTPDGRLNAENQAAVERYRKIGYPVLLTSTFTGFGMEEFRQALKGKLSVLVGKSGVGKSSLLNALEPGLGLRAKAVSALTGKGRHTTSHMEMFDLAAGGSLVDTPGVREFGLWDVDPDDLGYCFPEMRDLIGRCRFGLDCSHNEEPGCVIRKAVTAGQISPERYQSYLTLKDETT
ncbi:MAG TPA: ribosome small subunit-dependent GTPase A [Longilinea sp.]|nr:ribosome small subunit-dependent GTPase A [Longilinea sp.]